MSRTKVAIVHYQAYPEVRMAKFARSLVDAGYDVTVLCRQAVDGRDSRTKHPYAARVQTAGESLHVVAVEPEGYGRAGRAAATPYPFNPLWRRAIRALLDDGCRLIIVHDFHLVLAATSQARKRGVPVVFDVSENYPALLEIWRRLEGRRKAVVNSVARNIRLARTIERAGLRAADAVTAVVPEHVERLRALMGRPDAPVTIVDNTPQLDELLVATPEPSGRATETDKPLEVVYTGEIHVYRGIDTVIAAAALLQRDGGPPVRFMLIGTGVLMPQLQQQAVAAGVQDVVDFRGWQADLTPFMAGADVGLIPPHASEHYDMTMPNKLYDFMAFAKPVVISDVRPMRRVVESAGCGEWFRPGDPADLARAIRRLSDPVRRAELGERGRQAVLAEHHWGIDGQRLVDLVRRLLDESRARSGGPPTMIRT